VRGPELIRRLGDRRRGLRVLFVSGYARETLPEDQLAEPGIAFLQKPFHPDTLLRSVREILDQN
jgi:FixJ family two-component response regulator